MTMTLSEFGNLLFHSGKEKLELVEKDFDNDESTLRMAVCMNVMIKMVSLLAALTYLLLMSRYGLPLWGLNLANTIAIALASPLNLSQG